MSEVSSGQHPRNSENKGRNQFFNLMRDTGFSQSELARRVSVHPNTVSKWSTGQSRMPGAVIAYLKLYRDVKALIERD